MLRSSSSPAARPSATEPMKALGDQLLTRAALAHHQHWPIERRSAAGALDSIQKSRRLADKLIAVPCPFSNIGIFHHSIAINTSSCWMHIFAQMTQMCENRQIGTVPAKHLTSRQTGLCKREETTCAKISKPAITQTGQKAVCGVAVALSMSMIFTSYAVSVLNHREGGDLNAQIIFPRPLVVSYLA